MFCGGVTGEPELRVIRPAFQQVTAVRAGWANRRESHVYEFRDYAVAAVYVLVRELVGALRGLGVYSCAF